MIPIGRFERFANQLLLRTFKIYYKAKQGHYFTSVIPVIYLSENTANVLNLKTKLIFTEFWIYFFISSLVSGQMAAIYSNALPFVTISLLLQYFYHDVELSVLEEI